MQVPVLAMRQVVVKVVPPATFVLSGMVISATNEAWFVQSGALVGTGVPTVGVMVGGVDRVAVMAVSLAATVGDSSVEASVKATSAVGTSVSVAGAGVVSTAPWPVQAVATSTTRAATVN